MTESETRFGIYYVPKPTSVLAHFGAGVLGRDIETDAAVDPLSLPEISPCRQRQGTEAARHYGFHATLKPPFCLARGTTFEDLDKAVWRLASSAAPVLLAGLEPASEGGFVALRPLAATSEVDALAAACMRDLDNFRAPASEGETQRRRTAGLTPRQEELLARWGYPYVLDEFRFHMTLTDRLTVGEQARWKSALAAGGADRFSMPILIEDLAIVSQPDRKSPFRVMRRHTLKGKAHCRGHCFLVVGPSGSGKDTLIDAMRVAFASDGFHFPARIITRPADAGGEKHHSVSVEDFEALQRNGAFCLSWDAHGFLYGVPDREVEQALAAGRHVILNVSRTAIDEARRRFGPGVTVINVTAPVDVLAERLRQRSRESAAEIRDRLARACAKALTGLDVVEFANDQPALPSTEVFANILRSRLATRQAIS